MVQAILDDQIVKTQSMRASPFIGPLEKEALEWDETLNRLQEVVDNWLACQATWQYLEPIFTSPDIMKQMPEEGDKFLQVLFTIVLHTCCCDVPAWRNQASCLLLSHRMCSRTCCYRHHTCCLMLPSTTPRCFAALSSPSASTPDSLAGQFTTGSTGASVGVGMQLSKLS